MRARIASGVPAAKTIKRCAGICQIAHFLQLVFIMRVLYFIFQDVV